MIEIPGVTQEIEAEDADVLDRGIVEDLERETTIVIEEIGEIILLVDETLTEVTDTEEIITGTMTSATTDV
jgi:transcription termination factor Rho